MKRAVRDNFIHNIVYGSVLQYSRLIQALRLLFCIALFLVFLSVLGVVCVLAMHDANF